MAAVRKLARFTERAKFLSKCYFASQNGTLGSFCTMVQQPQRTQGLLKLGLIGAATGVAVGAGYAYHRINEARKNIALEGTQLDTELLKYKPPVTPSRKVSRRSLRDRSRVASRVDLIAPVSFQITSPLDSTGLKLTLFQYQTCPFCCKVDKLSEISGSGSSIYNSLSLIFLSTLLDISSTAKNQ